MPDSGITSIHPSDVVRVGETPVGKGVFAQRGYPVRAVIGEITGKLCTCGPVASSYAFEIDDRTHLEPAPPFRFLNHSCDPNCEFDSCDDGDVDAQPTPLYLIALRDIWPGEELTIDYNWPASGAIPCRCAAASCRGWIVSVDELHLLSKPGASGGDPAAT